MIDKSIKKQLEYYLKYNLLTPHAKHKLITFLLFCINHNITTSNIPGEKGARRLMARYKIVRAQLPLGLTRFDLNDTFMHIVSSIDLHFLNQEYRAAGGFTMKQIRTQTFNTGMEGGFQPQQPEPQDTISRLKKRIGGQ